MAVAARRRLPLVHPVLLTVDLVEVGGHAEDALRRRPVQPQDLVGQRGEDPGQPPVREAVRLDLHGLEQRPPEHGGAEDLQPRLVDLVDGGLLGAQPAALADPLQPLGADAGVVADLHVDGPLPDVRVVETGVAVPEDV